MLTYKSYYNISPTYLCELITRRESYVNAQLGADHQNCSHIYLLNAMINQILLYIIFKTCFYPIFYSLYCMYMYYRTNISQLRIMKLKLTKLVRTELVYRINDKDIKRSACHRKRAHVDNDAMKAETVAEIGEMSTLYRLTKQLGRHPH